MAEFNNIGVKAKPYSWLREFQDSLEKRLDRRVTYSEIVSILIGVAAKGQSADKLAQSLARNYKEEVSP